MVHLYHLVGIDFLRGRVSFGIVYTHEIGVVFASENNGSTVQRVFCGSASFCIIGTLIHEISEKDAILRLVKSRGSAELKDR